MSKLLEILRKSKGDIADAVAPLICAESRRIPEVNAALKGESNPSPVPAEAIAPLEAPPLARVRTLSLRVAAPSPLLPFENSHWQPSEQYRILRTKIGQHPKQPRLILVTSPHSGDGKSVTAINTAAALALKSEGRVLLVDADLRKSVIHAQLGLPESPGLADVLAGASTPEEAMAHTQEFPNLYVMSAGTPRANPVELLDSQRWRSLCAHVRDLFRYVVIDSPPVGGGLADYDLIQAVCDGVVLVLRPDMTNRALCWSALELIPKTKFLGVVLNCIPDWSPGRPAASGYYGYRRDSGAS